MVHLFRKWPNCKKIVPLNMCAKEVREVSITFRYPRLIPRGNTIKMIRCWGVAVVQIRIVLVLMAVRDVKTRGFFNKLP